MSSPGAEDAPADESTTMDRRKFIAGLGSLAAGSAAVMGSGAFTSTAADRTVSVSIAGDQSAYLKLVPGSSPHAYTENGQLVLDFDGSEVSGAGLNTDSFIKFNEIFSIQNQSGDTTAVWLDEGDTDAPYVNNGASADFASKVGIAPYRIFWSFSRDSQPDYYADSEVGYRKFDDSSQDAPEPGRTTDTLGNKLESGLDDYEVLAPVNVDTNKSDSIFNRVGQHPAVLGSGDSISINLQFNLDDIDPSTITDASGTVVLNAYTHNFAEDLQTP